MSKDEIADFEDHPIGFLENSDFDQSKNLKIAKMNPDTTYMIMVFANWCGPCKAAKPHYRRLSKILERAGVNSVRLLAINATPGDRPGEKALVERLDDFGVTGFPTFLISSIDANGNVVLNKYQGGRTPLDFINYLAKTNPEIRQKLPEIQKILKTIDELC